MNEGGPETSPLFRVIDSLEHTVDVLNGKTKSIRNAGKDLPGEDRVREESSDVVARLSSVVLVIERINKELEI